MLRILTIILFLFYLLPVDLAHGKLKSFYNGKEKRVALVIGVGKYEFVTALENPRNDANAIAISLERLGFNVIKSIDPTYADMRELSISFLEKLQGADVAMLYYAGHSVQFDGANFLIPVDASLEKVSSFSNQTYELARLVNLMDKLAKTKIIILDACRDNPFVTRLESKVALEGATRKISRGLAGFSSLVSSDDLNRAKFSTYGTVVSYSAAPGKVAEDGQGANSPYTSALLKLIETPGIEIGRLFRLIARKVIKETGGRQKPEYLVKLSDEFYLRNPEPHKCDFLAAEPQNNLSIKGVDFDSIDAKKAIPACLTAIKVSPENPRYLHNLARAYDSIGKHQKSIPYYTRSASLGYVHAINNLGVMYINGLGVKQNFAKGASLLKKAKSRGHIQSRVNLQGTDFSVLMKSKEIKILQKKLEKLYVYSGNQDGKYEAETKEAVLKFQRKHNLAENGLSLETLDQLNLISIIPSFSLQ
jgi:hypothetical protein